jgi:glutaredoxin
MARAWLSSWFRRRQPPPAPLDVLLYTRRGCHLCEEAWQRLEEARCRYGFALRAEDVDADVKLAERFGEQVPVVVVNGKVRFWGSVNPVLLDRLLHALSRSVG